MRGFFWTFLEFINRPMIHAPKAKPVIKAHKTALIAYSVPPNTKANCLIQMSSYTRLAAPEIKRQKKGITFGEVIKNLFALDRKP